MTRDLSSLRAQVLAVQQQITELLDTFLGRTPLLPGSLYTLRRRCGKPNCRCAHSAAGAASRTAAARRANSTPAPSSPTAARAGRRISVWPRSTCRTYAN